MVLSLSFIDAAGKRATKREWATDRHGGDERLVTGHCPAGPETTKGRKSMKTSDPCHTKLGYQDSNLE